MDDREKLQRWLDGPPPELLQRSGSAIEACAELELEIRSAALKFVDNEAAWPLVHGPEIETIRTALIKMNSESPLHAFVDELNAALKGAQDVFTRRNALAHGSWLITSEGYAAIRHARGKQHLTGVLTTKEWLDQLTTDATDLSQEINRIMKIRDQHVWPRTGAGTDDAAADESDSPG